MTACCIARKPLTDTALVTTFLRQWLPSLPVLQWGRQYSRETLLGDGVAAHIATIMLIAQSLAYAMLAGLPPEVGL